VGDAAGLAPAALSAAVAAKLRNGFIREPHVAVEIEAYRPFFILGEVTNPGQYPYVANMTAEAAVAIAGGFTPRVKRPSGHAGADGQSAGAPLAFPAPAPAYHHGRRRWF
jgi:protein involved in polysaccharide export with SLBB domain